jgi:hypothetical protein
MDEAAKIQALPLNAVRERLLNRRHDGFVMAQRPSNPPAVPAASSTPPEASTPATPARKVKSARQVPPEERICAYSKCGVKFITTRIDQVYHTADCRKRAWFERNFAPIAKP